MVPYRSFFTDAMGFRGVGERGVRVPQFDLMEAGGLVQHVDTVPNYYFDQLGWVI